MTTQTIRNWIDHGTLPAAKIGRAFRVRPEDLEELLARAQADSTSLATRRDLWVPEKLGMPHRRPGRSEPASVWDPGEEGLPAKRA